MKLDIPTHPAARWEWIKYQIRMRGLTLAELARRLDVELGTLAAVKRTPYPRMERAIAKALDLQPAMIWPERWNHDGTPNRQRPNRAEKSASISSMHDSGSNVRAHRQMAAGA
ncbi:helix-turn-helix domain-containing protein [Halomonas sp. M1]|jgi:Ner family transcriptional regulator|uniref:helix-turn-helix domain-containing protein n=1 Tax=Halomonas sp. M1 TaxID=3035470 RepID=UPI000E9DEB1A|nr:MULTISPECIES: helix-turn-helix domain-containing protein [unclassified Halomonas]WFE70095.1 helix-turn-helix domain-containing protein [Halomonas sp. M1]HBN61434.1 nucleotide excision repair protein [Halomonas sp.]|tara:strand:+ start:1161 stop:1499 length:339 start_codon:yes stop_codon:yes gene_type:complete